MDVTQSRAMCLHAHATGLVGGAQGHHLQRLPRAPLRPAVLPPSPPPLSSFTPSLPPSLPSSHPLALTPLSTLLSRSLRSLSSTAPLSLLLPPFPLPTPLPPLPFPSASNLTPYGCLQELSVTSRSAGWQGADKRSGQRRRRQPRPHPPLPLPAQTRRLLFSSRSQQPPPPGP
eukprot:2259509-Rhodomonas_salina.1